jgi:chromosome segregation ATPase
MKPTLFTLLLAACFAVGSSLYAQDSNDQPLGDVVRKDQSKPKPKAKVTLDEDNTQPGSASASSDSAAGSGSSANASQTQDTATPAAQDTQAAQDAKSREDKIKDLDRQTSDINSSLSQLQDKIDHSDATEETKRVWREALGSGQSRLDEIQKQKEALKSPQGQNGTPAPAQQPASNPQQ